MTSIIVTLFTLTLIYIRFGNNSETEICINKTEVNNLNIALNYYKKELKRLDGIHQSICVSKK